MTVMFCNRRSRPSVIEDQPILLNDFYQMNLRRYVAEVKQAMTENGRFGEKEKY